MCECKILCGKLPIKVMDPDDPSRVITEGVLEIKQLCEHDAKRHREWLDARCTQCGTTKVDELAGGYMVTLRFDDGYSCRFYLCNLCAHHDEDLIGLPEVLLHMLDLVEHDTP